MLFDASHYVTEPTFSVTKPLTENKKEIPPFHPFSTLTTCVSLSVSREGFQIPTAMRVNVTVFWNTTTSSFMDGSLRNVFEDKYLRNYTV